LRGQNAAARIIFSTIPPAATEISQGTGHLGQQAEGKRDVGGDSEGREGGKNPIRGSAFSPWVKLKQMPPAIAGMN